jgi:large subunit ribosomal protein LP0
MSAQKGKKTQVNKKEKKAEYFDKLYKLLQNYSRILIVLCDNIGSTHMQKIRRELRNKAVLLMGKNTMIRKVIRLHLEEHPEWESLLEWITGNIGLVFTNDPDLKKIRDICLSTKVPAAAKAGIKAPSDVVIPKGITTLEPTKTSFLQALNIASKINRGTIEILQDVPLIKKGDKVGSSESTLLQMLDIRPFQYGLQMVAVYEEGATADASTMEMTDEVILSKFLVGVGNIASLSMGLHYPTVASFPHIVLNGFKNLLSISLGTEYSFEQANLFKQMAENPGAFSSSAAPSGGSAAPSGGGSSKPSDPEPEPEPEDEDEGLEFDLFG